jgi:hypothetical protein
VLHYFIAMSAAAVYYAVSRRLKFLVEFPVVCGLFYGIALLLVMNLIVLPLSAIHFRGPFQYAGLGSGDPYSHVLCWFADCSQCAQICELEQVQGREK